MCGDLSEAGAREVKTVFLRLPSPTTESERSPARSLSVKVEHAPEHVSVSKRVFLRAGFPGAELLGQRGEHSSL